MELVVTIGLIAAILTSVAHSHLTMSRLSKSARMLEDQERDLREEHDLILLNIDPASSVDRHCIIEEFFDLRQKRCTSRTAENKSAEVLVLSNNAGFSALEFVLTLFLLMVTFAISYPSIRQFILEKPRVERSERLRLSLSKILEEIKEKAVSAQLAALPEAINILDPRSALYLQLSALPLNHQPASQVLKIILLDPRSRFQTLSTGKQPRKMVICEQLDPEQVIYAGFYSQSWDLIEIQNTAPTVHANCPNKSGFSVLYDSIDFGGNAMQPIKLAGIKKAELIFLDSNKTLRRYFLQSHRSEPLLYNVERFQLNPTKSGRLAVTIAATENTRTLEKIAEIPVKKFDEASFLELAF